MRPFCQIYIPLQVNIPHIFPFTKLWSETTAAPRVHVMRNSQTPPAPLPSSLSLLHLVRSYSGDGPVGWADVDGGILLLPDDSGHLSPLPKPLQLVKNVEQLLWSLLGQELEHFWRSLSHQYLVEILQSAYTRTYLLICVYMHMQCVGSREATKTYWSCIRLRYVRLRQ